MPAREATPAGLQAALRRTLQRLVRSVALALLNFKPAVKPVSSSAFSSATDTGAQAQSYLLPLFDYLIAATRGMVAHGYLERFFPYSLVRQNFVSLANAQIGASMSKAFATIKFNFEDEQKE